MNFKSGPPVLPDLSIFFPLPGGLSEAVALALGEQGVNFTQRVLAIHEVPRSGKPDELLAKYRIIADAICEEARALCRA